MKLNKDDLFQNLNTFLSSRGVELKDGTYANAVQKTCAFLTEAFNMGQEGFERARTEVEKNLDRVRQVIHEQTAPRTAGAAKAETAAPPPPPKAESRTAPNGKARPQRARKPKAKTAPTAKKSSGRTKPKGK